METMAGVQSTKYRRIVEVPLGFVTSHHVFNKSHKGEEEVKLAPFWWITLVPLLGTVLHLSGSCTLTLNSV